MRIGIVCPYSFDIPGGVQFHVRDLAEWLIGQGHVVSVLAPADEDTPLPNYVVSVGRAVPVRYNGSTARLTFGPLTAARVGRWVDSGRFDVVHLHEPITPSVSMLALWAVEGPVVATFHTANLRSRVMQAAYPVLRPSLEKISGRIAVSEDARRTVTTHFGGDAVVIPNGVFVNAFGSALPRPQWQGSEGAPTMAFLGRIDEPRKGLPELIEAMPAIVAAAAGVRLFIAGHGDEDAARARMSPEVAAACTFLGGVNDTDKARLLASVDLFIAPHTGGESFGIVLIEAMSAGCPVLASDLPAFVRVLEGGGGETFAVGDPADLASVAVRLLRDPARRAALASVGSRTVGRFDWSVVGAEVSAVYETVVLGAAVVRATGDAGSVWSRLLRTGRGVAP